MGTYHAIPYPILAFDPAKRFYPAALELAVESYLGHVRLRHFQYGFDCLSMPGESDGGCPVTYGAAYYPGFLMIRLEPVCLQIPCQWNPVPDHRIDQIRRVVALLSH